MPRIIPFVPRLSPICQTVVKEIVPAFVASISTTEIAAISRFAVFRMRRIRLARFLWRIRAILPPAHGVVRAERPT
jgi:hypothetical protein